MFLKKLATAAVLSSALVAVSAQAALKQGWDVGARVGYQWHHDNLNIMANNAGNVLAAQPRIFDNGFTFGLFGGYQWLCQSLLMGLEANIDWMGSDEDHAFHAVDSAGNNYVVTARYERDLFYGASARMGYRWSDFFMPFARVGIERTNDTLKIGFNQNSPAGNASIFDHSKHLTGYLIGLGFEVPVFSPNSNMRIEYQYHWSNRANFNDSGLISGQYAYKPKMHFLSVGLLWSQV